MKLQDLSRQKSDLVGYAEIKVEPVDTTTKSSSTSARVCGLVRPLSTLSFSSSVAELAEFDCNTGSNSARIEDNDSVSPTADGFGDDLLLRMRSQNQSWVRPLDHGDSIISGFEAVLEESSSELQLNELNSCGAAVDWRWGNNDCRLWCRLVELVYRVLLHLSLYIYCRIQSLTEKAHYHREIVLKLCNSSSLSRNSIR